MAKKGGTKEVEGEATPPSSGPGIVISIVIGILLGGASGGGFGYFFSGAPSEPAVKAAAAPAAEVKADAHAEIVTSRFPRNAIEIPLAPIITSIGPEKKSNIRLDLSLIAAAGSVQSEVMKNEVREDVIALLWGLTVKDIEGGRGFQNLRTQLDERARARGQGAVLGVLVSGLIIK